MRTPTWTHAWTYDMLAQSAYLRLSDNRVLVTRRINDVVLIDLDEDAQIVGIEILDVDKDPRT